MRARIVADIFKKLRQRLVGTRERAGLQMDGVHVREIIKRDANLTVDDRIEIRVDFFGRAHVLARAYDEIDAGAHRPNQADRRDETEPIPTVLGFLKKHVRAEDAVGLPLPLAGDLREIGRASWRERVCKYG